MAKTEVTVLLAAYNGSAYIREMIDSVLAQDSAPLRLIVSDDGSTDGTADVLQSYADAYPEQIVHYRSGLRFGNAQKHFMHLLSQFHDSPYIMFCDQDDVWHTDKVRKTLEKMREVEHDSTLPALVHTDLRVVDGSLQQIAPSFLRYSALDGNRLKLNHLLVQNVVTGCTVMINRTLAQLAIAGGMPEAMLMHDWWLALIASACGSIGFLDEATIDYRQHGNNSVGAKNANSAQYLVEKVKGGSLSKSLEATAAQAGELLACFGSRLSQEQAALLRAFSSAPARGKLARMRIYGQNGLWKNSLKRRVGQIIWW